MHMPPPPRAARHNLECDCNRITIVNVKCEEQFDVAWRYKPGSLVE